MGDWNAKIGEKKGKCTVINECGMRKKNENGNKLIEFASRNNLKIANTLFPKKHKLKWT